MEKLASVTAIRDERRVADRIENDLVEEWKFISRVMDRGLFILFILVVSSFNSVLLSSSPFIFENEYCPIGDNGECDGMTVEEIYNLDLSVLHGHGGGGGDHGDEGGSKGGGHDSSKGGGGHGSPKGEEGHGPSKDKDGHGSPKGDLGSTSKEKDKEGSNSKEEAKHEDKSVNDKKH